MQVGTGAVSVKALSLTSIQDGDSQGPALYIFTHGIVILYYVSVDRLLTGKRAFLKFNLTALDARKAARQSVQCVLFHRLLYTNMLTLAT
jgi:hypothetical protein